MKTRILLAFSGLLLLACTKERLSNACLEDHPAEQVVWMKKIISSLEQSPYCNAVSRYQYRGQTVFVIGTCEPNFNSVNQIYDCEGNLLCGWGDSQCPDFAEQAHFERIVWRAK
jgi:hypothetical protein